MTFTKEDVTAALNRAAGVITDSHDGYESNETIRDDDIANLVVNLALHWLEHPDAGEDEAIAAQYAQYASARPAESDLDEGEEMPKKGSPRWNELVTGTVRGWIE